MISGDSMKKMKLNKKGQYLFFCCNTEVKLSGNAQIRQCHFLFAEYLRQMTTLMKIGLFL